MTRQEQTHFIRELMGDVRKVMLAQKLDTWIGSLLTRLTKR